MTTNEKDWKATAAAELDRHFEGRPYVIVVYDVPRPEGEDREPWRLEKGKPFWVRSTLRLEDVETALGHVREVVAKAPEVFRAMREPGFYWVHWPGNSDAPFVAEWVLYQSGGKEMGPPLRPHWWEMAGTEDTFDEGDLVVVSEKLVKP